MKVTILNRYKNMSRPTVKDVEGILGPKLTATLANIATRHKLRRIHKRPKLTDVFFETVSRCNGSCSFCPANKTEDMRPLHYLSLDQMRPILMDLEAHGFTGTVSMYGNNEPMLDGEIFGKILMVRAFLPDCRIEMYTNGTALTWDRVRELYGAGLNKLVIDQYSDDLSITPEVLKIIGHAQKSTLTGYELVVSKRLQHETLTSRAGQAPSMDESYKHYNRVPCLLPWTQMFVRADGKLGTCCADATWETSMGEATVENFLRGRNFETIREYLWHVGRLPLNTCCECDAVHI